MARPRRENPFKKNPLALIEGETPVKVPDAPETHEVRKPARSYLAKPGAALDGGSTPAKPRRIIERVREVVSADPEEAAVGEAGPPPPRPRHR
jgi:hypothetical protein